MCLQAIVEHDGDPHSEEQAAYRRKMGRWRRELKETITDNDFWLALYVFACSHSPLEHALNFIHSTDRSFKYATWVCGKSLEILAEFDALLSNPQWCIVVVQQGERQENIQSLLELGVGIIMMEHSSFKRRVHDLVASFPSRAIWLAHQHPNKACGARKQVATEILGSNEDSQLNRNWSGSPTHGLVVSIFSCFCFRLFQSFNFNIGMFECLNLNVNDVTDIMIIMMLLFESVWSVFVGAFGNLVMHYACKVLQKTTIRT